jgi:hypothetical protein
VSGVQIGGLGKGSWRVGVEKRSVQRLMRGLPAKPSPTHLVPSTKPHNRDLAAAFQPPSHGGSRHLCSLWKEYQQPLSGRLLICRRGRQVSGQPAEGEKLPECLPGRGGQGGGAGGAGLGRRQGELDA